MFSDFLISKFVKNYKNVKKRKVREGYGRLGGTVGIILNIILFIIKLSVGLLLNSIAATADAINNLSDVASSVITILGFKLSSKPADKEHPFGHGRIEYLSGLIVSFIVLLTGVEFIKASLDRILHPVPVSFNMLSFILIVLTIFAKLWLGVFNKDIANAINSTALKASSLDAFMDVIASSCVALSILLAKWVSFPIDGYIGLLVALFIIYSGFTLIKETLDQLLGASTDPELAKEIITGIMSYEYIYGVHDLIVHNYGPGRCMASIHVEVPCDISIMKIHEIVDEAEKKLSKKLNVHLVMHTDPINTYSEEVAKEKKSLEEILKSFSIINSFHDFRVVGEGEHKKLIFDIVINSTIKYTLEDKENLKVEIQNEVRKNHEFYNTVITVDNDFSVL